MNVGALMTSPAHTCSLAHSLRDAAAIMWEADCGVLPVLDDDGRVAGIITDRDICMTAYMRGMPLEACSVGSAIAGDVVSCRPEDPLDAVQETMRALQIRRLPVVDDEMRPLGMLSLNDLALAAPRAENGRLGIRRESVLATLAAISQHRVPDTGA